MKLTGVTFLAESLLSLVGVEILFGIECDLAQIFDMGGHDERIEI